jgi:protein TonB
MSIVLKSMIVRLLPVAASLLLHAAACAGIALIPVWVYTRESVLIADLVQPDPAPPPPPPVKTPEPAKRDRRPLTPPEPIETPMPAPPERPAETAKTEAPPPPVAPPPADPAPPAAPVAPVVPAPVTPAPVAPAPAPPGGRGPLAPADAPSGSGADALPTQAGSPAPARPAPGLAALPPEGVTRTAAPRGGYQVKPSYPASARRAGAQGTTLLGVLVGADGRVGDVVVRQSAGHPDLDAAAANAVRRWRFEPARRGSEAVAMWVLLPVEFRLR